jgi:hypothetical protein
MRREFAKSLHLHRAIARKVAADYEGEVAKAKDLLDRHRASVPPDAWWLVQWDRVLNEYDKTQLLELLVSDSEFARDMRSSSPFTRALSQRERTALLRQFTAHWPASRLHETA